MDEALVRSITKKVLQEMAVQSTIASDTQNRDSQRRIFVAEQGSADAAGQEGPQGLHRQEGRTPAGQLLRSKGADAVPRQKDKLNGTVLGVAGYIPIGVSARHVHLCKDHLEALFGTGYKLTPQKELMGGQFAAAETISLVGPNGVLKARVLGPLRAVTQVEISATDNRTLGLSAPLRDSGNISNSAAVTLVGPCGAVYLSTGCIIARRHIHMPPRDAALFGLKDKDIVKVGIDGPRGGIFNEVLVRVDTAFTLEMHIDTDEANGLGITSGTRASLLQREAVC